MVSTRTPTKLIHSGSSATSDDKDNEQIEDESEEIGQNIIWQIDTQKQSVTVRILTFGHN